MKLCIYVVALTISLVGCTTTHQELPTSAVLGPTAKISDFGYSDDGKSGKLFYVKSIDNMAVENSLDATRHASWGHGFGINIAFVERDIPIRPLRFQIVGRDITGAPIHELFKRATDDFLAVEGEVTFALIEGHRYFVTGKLIKESSSLWIADVENETIPASDVVVISKK